MRRHFAVSAAILSIAVASSGGRAQVMGMGRGINAIMLLNLKEVQKELRMKSGQVKRLQEKQRAMSEVGKSKDWSAMSNAMAMMASTDELEKWASDVLDPDQVKRFHELLLQHEGPLMFAEPSVVKALDLSHEQTSRASTILDKYDLDSQAIFMEMRKVRGNGSLRAIHKKMEDLKKSVGESLRGLLTPDQTSRWESAQGAKYKFPKTADSVF